MLRKIALPAMVAAAFAPAALVTGCGAADKAKDAADKATGVDVAKAADATAGKESAKFNMTMSVSGAGVPSGTEMTANGVTSLTESKLSMKIDFGSLMKAAGSSVSGETSTDLLVDGPQVWLRIPKIQGLDQMAGGKSWVSLDIKKVLEKMGVDASAIGQVYKPDPASQIKSLTAAKTLKKVGTEQMDGTEVTHFKGTISAREMIDNLPADQKEQANKAIDQLTKAGGAQAQQQLDQKNPIELWIDEDNVVHREVMQQNIPGQNGQAGGAVKVDIRLNDFGADLNLDKPDSGETLDVTDMLLSSVGSAMGGGLGGATTTTTPTVPTPTVPTPTVTTP